MEGGKAARRDWPSPASAIMVRATLTPDARWNRPRTTAIAIIEIRRFSVIVYSASATDGPGGRGRAAHRLAAAGAAASARAGAATGSAHAGGRAGRGARATVDPSPHAAVPPRAVT